MSVALADNLKHGKYSLSAQNARGDVIGWTDVKVDKSKKAPKSPKQTPPDPTSPHGPVIT